jgi:hypothetical protein
MENAAALQYDPGDELVHLSRGDEEIVTAGAKKKVIGIHESVKSNKERNFFALQLGGEEALTQATAAKLFGLASEVHGARPWERMGDTDLVLVRDPVSDQMCYCCVMGALGEYFAVHVYLGPDGYRFFKRIQREGTISPGDFYGSQSGVTAEFVPSAELSAPDRELARAFGHPLSRGLAAPQFRTNRKGYQPWYVTEPEATVLALGLESVLAFCQVRKRTPNKQYWAHEDVYPEVVWTKHSRFSIRETLVKTEPPPPPEPAVLDEASLAKLQKKDYAIRGAIEMDHFYTSVPIGKEHERKACLRSVLTIDAETRLLYAAEVVEPSEAAGRFLVRVLIDTIQGAGFIPAEVRVKDPNAKILLSSLAERLGFAVVVRKKLAVLEPAKRELLRTLGDPE